MNATPKQTKAGLKLTPLEKRSSISLAILFATRMLGLFLLTPIFAVSAHTLIGGNDPVRVGLALGAYGLTQAIMQIPLGMASDRYGRRPVIVFGMLLFVLGGLICAFTDNIDWVTVGRVIQGLGAVSAAITAWIADATRPQVRTRAMAMVGASIGISFALSLVVSPLIVGAFGLSGLFWAISLLGFVCLLIAMFFVPAVPRLEEDIVQASFADVLAHKDLLRLNFGVFCLHFILMAVFMVTPGLLGRLGAYDSGTLWEVYLPVILASFVFMVPAIFYTETHHVHKYALEWSVLGLAIFMGVLPWISGWFWPVALALVGFFVSFNIIEALQPSLVSHVAPPSYKGLALGFYNTAQSLGVFVGSVMGGIMVRASGPNMVFWVCAMLAVVWLYTARGFKQTRMAD